MQLNPQSGFVFTELVTPWRSDSGAASLLAHSNVPFVRLRSLVVGALHLIQGVDQLPLRKKLLGGDQLPGNYHLLNHKCKKKIKK